MDFIFYFLKISLHFLEITIYLFCLIVIADISTLTNFNLLIPFYSTLTVNMVNFSNGYLPKHTSNYFGQ